MKEALKLALEALENHCGNYKLDDEGVERFVAACKAIKEALEKDEKWTTNDMAYRPNGLAQPEQEPVEDVVAYHSDGTRTVRIAPKRPWAGLTVVEIMREWHSANDSVVDFARVIEAKLKEKNT